MYYEITAQPGLEPGKQDPNSCVLPLHHRAI